MLRTTLRFLGDEPPHVIGITSAAPQEGKSTLVANLAASMIYHGLKVLVIDADLHHPTQHEFFGVPRAPGLTELQARYRRLLHPGRVGDRWALARRTTALADSEGDEYLAWGALWTLDTLLQLGRRVELNASMMTLTVACRRLRDPAWDHRLATARACLALLDGHHGDVPAFADQALALGREHGIADAGFVDLVLRSELAMRTGEGLGETEERVRAALVGAPFFAHGWHALVLAAMGRTEDALRIWDALEPHLESLPPDALEWLVATAGHVDLCLLAGDRGAAERLYAMLSPHADLHVTGGILTPYKGPVAWYLGRLAVLLGDGATGHEHLAEARRSAVALHAPHHVRLIEHEVSALGRRRGTLSNREHEIAALVALGLTNREIAERLVLSVRTVDNHVSSILRKLDAHSRAAIATWITRSG